MSEKLRVELKAVRSMKGDETPAFSARLYLDGKAVAEVRSEGRGGAPFVEWLDLRRDKILQKRWAEYCAARAEAEEEDLDLGSAGLDPHFWKEECAIFGLYDEHEERAFLRRQCRGRTLYRTGTQKPGEWLTLENEYTETVRLYLVAQHGEEVEIGNEKIR